MKQRFDWTILVGIGVGITAIVAGAWAEHLNLAFLWNPTAALIVGGGTLGSVIVRRGFVGIVSAIRAVWHLRLSKLDQEAHNAERSKLAWLSRMAQKNGVKAFENYATNSDDLLVINGLTLVADGSDQEQIKAVLQRQISHEDEIGLEDSATLEAAGGFAPTFGILGAVLGLISVLRVLDRPAELGSGIASAFVATIYGLSLANLVFFPLAARLRARHDEGMKLREELVSVILALAAKEPPRTIMNQFNLPK
jgi:chemotaxis protein MotA